jgi:formylglycine-generating enzyme required for sulfatase activity
MQLKALALAPSAALACLGGASSALAISQPAIQATFVTIPHGAFPMGSPASETQRFEDETPHTVTLTHDFEMQTTDVTQLQWFQVMGTSPSYFKSPQYCKSDFSQLNGTALCPNNPVEQVSWNDAQTMIQKLNQSGDGYTYRLPTEAEWEYAARGGAHAAYSFGDNVEQLGIYAWFADNSNAQTHIVAAKIPNALGLYDMAGNVLQLTQDVYGEYPAGSGATDPQGAVKTSPPSAATYRVFRGCTWNTEAHYCRSAARDYGDADYRLNFLGLRLVRTRN